MVEDYGKYLKERHFAKRLDFLHKKYANKKIVVYGTGIMFENIVALYDLSKLNIVAVSDRKYCSTKPEKYLGFETCAPDDIKQIKPDVVLVATLKTVAIVEDLRYNLLLDTGIQVHPLVKKKVFEILEEIWK